MTKDQYLRMVEQTGEEIDWERCPPDAEDFPQSVLTIMNVYNSLGNRIESDIGFVGKDFTNLNLLSDLENIVTDSEKDWAFELLLYLDSYFVAESQQKMKAEFDKMKKK